MANMEPNSQRAPGRRQWNLRLDLDDVVLDQVEVEYRHQWQHQVSENEVLTDREVRLQRMDTVNSGLESLE